VLSAVTGEEGGMSRHYNEIVQANTQPGEFGTDLLIGFTWRGTYYQVADVLGIWQPTERSTQTRYRIVTPDHQVFELYETGGVWILGVVQD
jgi:hypothetical protein